MKLIRQFKVGDKVKRASQAAGSWVVKVGTVAEVVPAWRRPPKYRTIGTRKRESYVVDAIPVKAVMNKPNKRKPAPPKYQTYWPNATALRPWSGSMAPSATRVSR